MNRHDALRPMMSRYVSSWRTTSRFALSSPRLRTFLLPMPLPPLAVFFGRSVPDEERSRDARSAPFCFCTLAPNSYFCVTNLNATERDRPPHVGMKGKLSSDSRERKGTWFGRLWMCGDVSVSIDR